MACSQLPSVASMDPLPAWGDVDFSLLDEPVQGGPAFPLGRLPLPWRAWVGDTARALGVPAEYVVTGLLAAVAAVCGCGVQARVAPWWSEPLVLRLALLARGSSGRTPALAAARRLLADLEAELERARPDRPPRLVVSDPGRTSLVSALESHPRGVVLWCDGETSGEPFADLPLATSVLAAGEPRWASRFLFAWPERAGYVPLAERRAPDDARLRELLGCLHRVAGSPERPLWLDFEPAAVAALDRFLAALHGEAVAAQGLHADWLGKGGAMVVRLSGLLAVLEWSGSGVGGPPGPIPAGAVDTAVLLWREYFRPHAALVFDRAGPTDLTRQARRVVHWLRTHRVREVSREQVRRHALAGSVSAGRATTVLGVLSSGGLLRSFVADGGRDGGRPRMRWEVNPLLLANRPAETAECGAMLPQAGEALS
ncbi:MAG: DUF3987 domain-containing protein [Reyranellaceae bacterium]